MPPTMNVAVTIVGSEINLCAALVMRTVNGEANVGSEGNKLGEILVASHRAREAASLHVPSDAERDQGIGARHVAGLGRSRRRRSPG